MLAVTLKALYRTFRPWRISLCHRVKGFVLPRGTSHWVWVLPTTQMKLHSPCYILCLRPQPCINPRTHPSPTPPSITFQRHHLHRLDCRLPFSVAGNIVSDTSSCPSVFSLRSTDNDPTISTFFCTITSQRPFRSTSKQSLQGFDTVCRERTMPVPSVQNPQIHGPKMHRGGDFVKQNEQISCRRERFLTGGDLTMLRMTKDVSMQIGARLAEG